VTGAPVLAVGTIAAIFRYPVKSMRGEAVAAATLGWHGVEGDRRLALRRLDERGGFPWLTAGTLPDLIHYTPAREGEGGAEALPTHGRTPQGETLPIFGGIFDDASVSVIAAATVEEIGRLAGCPADVRRFRPNIVVRGGGAPFGEDGWVGGVLTFGDPADAAAVAVTMPDVRCGMVNLDPDGGPATPRVLKAVVGANGNRAGIYGTVTRAGRIAVGQTVWLHRSSSDDAR
jgi:uncharacterized protein YcbX